jgi:hypothetical protein
MQCEYYCLLQWEMGAPLRPNARSRSLAVPLATCFLTIYEPFGCADKPTEKHRWLICCERKILFRLKKQAKKDGL